MRDLDQALARAYAARPRRGTAGDPAPAPPPPHFAVDEPWVEPGRDHDASAGLLTTGTAALAWPGTVLALERDHGGRFERMAETLLEARARRALRVLLFTSCHRAEGRTTLVLTLARALARRPGRTLIIDADLTGPMLARQLGLRPRFGLDDLVSDGLPLAEALIEAPDDNLAVLPLRAAVPRPRDFLASPAWSCLMARLRREFDLVLVDGSPLFAGLNATVLHTSVDAAILVHHRSLTGQRSLVRAQEVLAAGGVPMLGLAETFV
jgi:Mrp family chromosome partitioning ATPase